MPLVRALRSCSPSRSCCRRLAHAQDAYPSKPVRMIVPFAPGGPADLIARVMAQKLSEDLGKQFYIENHAGAGGNLGVGIGAHAPADGYSMIVNSQATVTNRSLYKTLPYDPFKDLIAVTRIATTPNVIVVHPSVPAKTMKELVELIRSGNGQISRLRASRPRHAVEPVRRAVPADAESQAHLDPVRRRRPDDPVGGRGPHADRVLVAAAGVAAHPGRTAARARRHRRQAARQPAGRADHGGGRLSGQTAETPIGIFVPTGTPKEIVDLLHRKVVALVATADVKQKLANIGFAPIGDTPAEFAAFLKGEDEKWGKVIRDAGIKME